MNGHVKPLRNMLHDVFAIQLVKHAIFTSSFKESLTDHMLSNAALLLLGALI